MKWNLHVVHRRQTRRHHAVQGYYQFNRVPTHLRRLARSREPAQWKNRLANVTYEEDR